MKLLPAVLALVAFHASPTFGMFMLPEPVPVERLVKLATANVKKLPNDAEAHYTLARIHYLAFSTGFKKIGAFIDTDYATGLPRIRPSESFRATGDPELVAEAKKKVLAEMQLGW